MLSADVICTQTDKQTSAKLLKITSVVVPATSGVSRTTNVGQEICSVLFCVILLTNQPTNGRRRKNNLFAGRNTTLFPKLFIYFSAQFLWVGVNPGSYQINVVELTRMIYSNWIGEDVLNGMKIKNSSIVQSPQNCV